MINKRKQYNNNKSPVAEFNCINRLKGERLSDMDMSLDPLISNHGDDSLMSLWKDNPYS